MSALIDRLELWGFEDSVTIFADGSIGFGFIVTPVDVAAWDDSAMSGYSVKIATFLNSLPDGLDIQFVQGIAGGSQNIIERHMGLCSASASEAAKVLCYERGARLKGLDALCDGTRQKIGRWRY